MAKEQTYHLTGGCQCGRLRYDAGVKKLKGFYCHCNMCKRATGNIFASFLSVPQKALLWKKDRPKIYHSSSIADRGFCPDCGTPITFSYLDSEWVDLLIGTLDQPEEIEPSFHFAVESRLAAWHRPDGLKEERADSYAPLQERWQRQGRKKET